MHIRCVLRPCLLVPIQRWIVTAWRLLTFHGRCKKCKKRKKERNTVSRVFLPKLLLSNSTVQFQRLAKHWTQWKALCKIEGGTSLSVKNYLVRAKLLTWSYAQACWQNIHSPTTRYLMGRHRCCTDVNCPDSYSILSLPKTSFGYRAVVNHIRQAPTFNKLLLFIKFHF